MIKEIGANDKRKLINCSKNIGIYLATLYIWHINEKTDFQKRNFNQTNWCSVWYCLL